MFWKKKGMIDVGKMASRGLIKYPKKDYEPLTNKEGFVEINNTKPPLTQQPKQENAGFFDFLGFNSSENKNEEKNSFTTEPNGYSKRDVDVKIEELDNKIYKLEQRIELLERKAGVGSNW